MTTNLDQCAIAEVASLARDANRLQVVDLPREPEHVYGISDAGEKFRAVEARPPVRAYQAFTIVGLAQQINALKDVLNVDIAANLPGVFVGTESVIFVFNEIDDRRHTSTLKLNKTSPFQALIDMEKDGLYGQSDLVMALRTTFARSVSPESFLPAIRKLKMALSAEGDSQITHGRESMGNKITAEVSGIDGALAEEIKITVPVYDEVEFKVTIECAVHVNVTNATFVVKPLAGEIARSLREVNAHIEKELRELLDEGCEVYGASAFCVRKGMA